jgi:uncharacterized protein (TIGR02265 family)
VSFGAIDLRAARDQLDVTRRLREVPLTSSVRGVWFSMTAKYVCKLGPAEAAMWERMVPRRRRMPFLSYSLREYLEELATAAAIIDPKTPGEGVRQIWREAAPQYLATPFGRSLLGLLKTDPHKYLTWCCTHRDHFCNYGHWRTVFREPGYSIMEITGEPIWIEHAMRGGAEGTLRMFGVEGSNVEAELVSEYEGRVHVRWKPRLPS